MAEDTQQVDSTPGERQLQPSLGGRAVYLSRKVEVSMMILLERVKVSAVTRTRTGR